ncbi:MAG: GTP-binding protein Obg [Bacteroidetes bacterium HLUCCA01]|nr:MAG: GTP-binding protein Obg [Bacteroidetes bacterium HLUCCA01]
MRFADYAKMYLTAGNGGAGAVSFRREKYVPKGGPDGGDGGRGADIVLRGNRNLNTLLDLRYKKFLKSTHGENGSGANKSGRDGEPVILDVPLGTIAYEFETRRLLGEVTEDGQQLVIAKGGQGGKGNSYFKSDVNQTPRYAQPGVPGEEIIVEIELKLIAEVGLVGYPNAGKSTLLAALSNARPKIADYPFTTMEPNLGVVTLGDYRSFVMADIPGIIEDAHKGKGLGIRFLRHIERNKVLMLVISCMSNIEEEYRILMNELREYRADLLEKPRLVVVSQMDLKPGFELEELPDLPDDYILVSAATSHNLKELKDLLWSRIQEAHE